MENKDQIRLVLEQCAHFNNGWGLIVPPTLARKLRAMGIHGPYTIRPDLPE